MGNMNILHRHDPPEPDDDIPPDAPVEVPRATHGEPTVTVRDDSAVCPSCNVAMYPHTAFRPGVGAVHICSNPDCRAVLGAVREDLPPPSDDGYGEDSPPSPASVPRKDSQAAAPRAPFAPSEPPGRRGAGDDDGPLDVLGLARKRLAWVKKELKRLGRLQTEREELERVLSAVGPKPRRGRGVFVFGEAKPTEGLIRISPSTPLAMRGASPSADVQLGPRDDRTAPKRRAR